MVRSSRPNPRALRRVLDELEVPAVYRSEVEEAESSSPGVRKTATPWASKHSHHYGGPTPSMYSDALAEEICQRIADGESMADIAMSEHMPIPGSVYRWRKTHPEFREAYFAASQAAFEKFGSKVFIHFDADIAREICERIEEGEMMSSILADPIMPGPNVINRWKREHPEFLAAYNTARETSAEACEHNAIREAALAHDRDSAAVANVRARVWQWAAGVRNPRTHGNKLDATISIEVGLADRLTAAMARVGRTIDAELVVSHARLVGDGAVGDGLDGSEAAESENKE